MNTTGALPEALIAEGWTSTGKNRAAAGHEERCRELRSRDGLLTVWVSTSPSGSSILLTAKVVNRPGMRRRGWQAQLDRLPEPVALAAITAAGLEPADSWPTGAESMLTAAGWQPKPDADESDDDPDEQGVFEFYDSLDDAFLHFAWASPDGTRSVEWFGPDDDPAFWSIDRPGGERRPFARLTHYAPAAVIAALALTD